MARKITGTVAALDPTLPVVDLDLDGKSYRLCFDFAALIAAERRLREAGQHVNMLHAMDVRSMDVERLVILFFASLVRVQPEKTLEDAAALITMQNFGAVYEAVVKAYSAAVLPKKEGAERTADPTPAAGE